jgi:hypothetical protein
VGDEVNKDKIRALIAEAVGDSSPQYIDVRVYEDHIEWEIEYSITLTFAHLDALSLAFGTKRIDIDADPGSDGSWTYGGGGSKGSTVIRIWPGPAFAISDAARDDIIPGGRRS